MKCGPIRTLPKTEVVFEFFLDGSRGCSFGDGHPFGSLNKEGVIICNGESFGENLLCVGSIVKDGDGLDFAGCNN